MDQDLYAPDDLEKFALDILIAGGMRAADAGIAASSLVAANLRGVDTHGIRFAPVYANCMRRGLMNPAPDVRIETLGPSLLSVLGDNGEGHYVATLAMERTIEMAVASGACSTTIRDTNHVGMLAYYVEMASRRKLIGHAATNGEPYVAPTGGITPVLSTNPMAWAIPAGESPDIVVDMATTTVANSKIRDAAGRGEKIPLTWGFDSEGQPTEDPNNVTDGGLLQPLGGYKGYGLMLVVDVFAGILSGGAFSSDLVALDMDRKQGIGAFMSVIDPGRFMETDLFLARVDEEIRRLRGSRPAAGVDRIRYHGELEAQTRAVRADRGIPIPPEHMGGLIEASRKFEVSFPEPV